MFTKLLTNNYKDVPLFFVTFDLQKYRKFGKENTCTSNAHPTIAKDQHVKDTLNELIDYIRDNYDMEELCK